jgi:serine/threonine protein kinase
MFRIVEDTEPPIPETVSPLLNDFLMNCFQKDPAMRPDAPILAEHMWLKGWNIHKVCHFVWYTRGDSYLWDWFRKITRRTRSAPFVVLLGMRPVCMLDTSSLQGVIPRNIVGGNSFQLGPWARNCPRRTVSPLDPKPVRVDLTKPTPGPGLLSPPF